MMERYEAAAPDVVSEDIDGELLVINLKTGVYFRGEGGTVPAWHALTRGVPVSQFAAPTAELRGFVAALLEHGLIRPRCAGGSPEPGTVTLPEGGLALERFDDLADMLTLDPVHDVDAERGWPVRK